MNYVASAAAPRERIRGATSESDTSQPQNVASRRGDGGMESGQPLIFSKIVLAEILRHSIFQLPPI